LEKQKSSSFDHNFYRDLALATLVFFLAALIPLVGAVIMFFIPLPVLYFYAKNGRLKCLVLLVLALLLSFAVLTRLNANGTWPLLAAFAALGVVIAECLKRNYSLEKIILSSVAALFTPGASLICYHALQRGETPWHLVQTYIEKQLKFSVSLYAGWNVATEQINAIKDNIPAIAASITEIFPALFLIALMFLVWANLLAGRAMLKKCGLPAPDFGDLSYWKPPEKMVWYLIGAGAMILLPDNVTSFIGWNTVVVISAIYLLAGLAIVSFFLKKSTLPAGFRYVIYFLIFAQQMVTLLVAAAGLFDLWADFRKLNKRLENPIV